MGEYKYKFIGGIREEKTKAGDRVFMVGEVKFDDIIWKNNKKGEKIASFLVFKNENREKSWHNIFTFAQSKDDSIKDPNEGINKPAFKQTSLSADDIDIPF